MTLTLGVSVISHGDTVVSVIEKADMVMYQGKLAGRNCIIFFESIPNSEITGIS